MHRSDKHPNHDRHQHQETSFPGLLSENGSGRISFCTVCEQFALAFGPVRIALSPRRVLELDRVLHQGVSKQGEPSRVRLRIAHGVALDLTPGETTDLLALLAGIRNGATSQLPLQTTDPHWIH